MSSVVLRSALGFDVLTTYKWFYNIVILNLIRFRLLYYTYIGIAILQLLFKLYMSFLFI